MLSIYVCVHRTCISSEDPDVRRQSPVSLEFFQFGQELGAVLDVGRDEMAKFLKPVMTLAAHMIQKSPAAAHNRSHFPGSLVHLRGHSEFGCSASRLFVGGIKKVKFSW